MKTAILPLLAAPLTLATTHHAHAHLHNGLGFSPAHHHFLLAARGITSADDPESLKPSILSKLGQIVPTAVASSILANPSSLDDAHPPDFWNQLSTPEKSLLHELYPANKSVPTTTAAGEGEQDTATVCTSTSTTTITMTLTNALPTSPTPSAAIGTSVAPDTSVTSVSAASSTTASPPPPSASVPPASSVVAPFGNSTAATLPVIGTAPATGNVSASATGVPSFTGEAADRIRGAVFDCVVAVMLGVGVSVFL